jgi:hypothetical protein
VRKLSKDGEVDSSGLEGERKSAAKWTEDDRSDRDCIDGECFSMGDGSGSGSLAAGKSMFASCDD